jgi:RNA polymerase sigma factor (sigma-70 family)
MIVANKTYTLNYRGREHSIKRNDLKRLTNRLAAGYRTATPERRNKIWEIILQLNWKYIYNAPFNFTCDMDQEDYRGLVAFFMWHALNEYQESKGDFTTYLASWKHAAFSKWQDQRESIRIPANQRLALFQIRKKIRDQIQLTDADRKAREELDIHVCSLSAPAGTDDGQVQDMLPGEDPRDAASLPAYPEIWKRIEAVLTPGELQIFKWYHHEDHRLNYREIGERVNLSRERIRQLLAKMGPKVRRALRPLMQDLRG